MGRLADITGRTAKNRRGRPFPPGQSGNPGGRPREDGHLRELCRAQTELAIVALVEILSDKAAPAAARVAAANAILDRGWGKPIQTLAGDESGSSLRIVIERPHGSADDEQGD